jgi:hypothetical protein
MGIVSPHVLQASGWANLWPAWWQVECDKFPESGCNRHGFLVVELRGFPTGLPGLWRLWIVFCTERVNPSQATRISKKWAYLCQAAGEVTYQCLQCTHIKYNMIQYHTIHMWKNVCLRVYMYVYVSTCMSIYIILDIHIYYILYMNRITLDR